MLQKNITHVLIGELALDYCVKITALQLYQAGFRVCVYLSACRTIEERAATIARMEVNEQRDYTLRKY